MTFVLAAGVLAVGAAVALCVTGAARVRAEAVDAGDVFRYLGMHTTRNARRGLQPASHLAALARRVTPAGRLATISERLDRAGSERTVDHVLATKVLWAAAAWAAVAVAVSPAFALVAAAAAWVAPDVLLERQVRRHVDGVRRALPDVLDLLAISVETGVGFDGALAAAAGDAPPELALEIRRIVTDLQLGRSRRDALVAFKERIAAPEVTGFVLAVLQAEALGSSMAAVLARQAAELRAVRRRRAREEAAKLPVKLLLPLIFGIFPALLIVVLGPAAITIVDTLGR